MDKFSGKIIRVTNIFESFKEKKRKEITPVGFIVGSKNIYVTISNGRMLIVDIEYGKNKKIIKVDGNKVSKPFVYNNNLFIIKNNSIIQFE